MRPGPCKQEEGLLVSFMLHSEEYEGSMSKILDWPNIALPKQSQVQSLSGPPRTSRLLPEGAGPWREGKEVEKTEGTMDKEWRGKVHLGSIQDGLSLLKGNLIAKEKKFGNFGIVVCS